MISSGSTKSTIHVGIFQGLSDRWHVSVEAMGIDEGSAAGFGADSTVIAVKTPGGRWQFVLQRPQTPAPADHGDATVMVQSLHRGDATDAQEKTFMGGLVLDMFDLLPILNQSFEGYCFDLLHELSCCSLNHNHLRRPFKFKPYF